MKMISDGASQMAPIRNRRPMISRRQPAWQSHVFTAAALRTMEFPEISYVIPGIIPEGLTILAGRPKIGKSWMALDVAIGAASGGKVLGGIHVTQGDVLYCCLEDNKRRLQRRVTKLLSPFGGEWPERLTLATRWRRLDQGGVEDIEAWCDSVPEPRLVMLDTLAGVRPTRGNAETLYESDYIELCSMFTDSPTSVALVPSPCTIPARWKPMIRSTR